MSEKFVNHLACIYFYRQLLGTFLDIDDLASMENLLFLFFWLRIEDFIKVVQLKPRRQRNIGQIILPNVDFRVKRLGGDQEISTRSHGVHEQTLRFHF